MSQAIDNAHNDHHEPSMTVKTIWLVFWVLLAITVLDFAIYFMMPKSGWRNLIFILFGVVKSYFIVGFFMHMRYEKVRLMAMIILPMAFVLGLIAALLYEGGVWSLTKWME